MDSQWLKTQFALNPEKTKAGLAQALGLEPSAVSKILKDMRQIKAQEYLSMRRYFGLPVESDRHKEPKQGKSAYVLETLPENNALQDRQTLQKSDEWVIPSQILDQRTKSPSGQVKIYMVQDTTMEPDFKRGETLLVDLSDTLPSPPGVFVIWDGLGHLVRRCEFLMGSGGSEIKISARDQSFSPQVLKSGEVEIVGRVIGKFQWL